jgi:hypothetical protein
MAYPAREKGLDLMVLVIVITTIIFEDKGIRRMLASPSKLCTKVPAVSL